MLCRVRGYNSGFGDYLRTGLKAGNKLHRDDLDKRVILHGDLEVTESIVESMPDKGNDRYLHITLAFKEDYISEEKMSEALSRFMKELMWAYNDEEFAYYAEAHLPKIKTVLNEKTGEMEDRKPHIHIILPKVNLVTGEYLNPAGYYPHNEKYVEAIQELINHDMQLASPRDNRRTDITDISDMISRHKGDLFKSDSRNLKERLLTDILMKEITSYKDFLSHLDTYGEIKIRNKSSSSPYLNLKETGSSKGVNLKEWVFTQEFINLSHEDKVKQIAKRFSVRDESMKATDYQNDTQILNEWHNLRSAEIKYLHPASNEYHEYKKLKYEEKLQYINQCRVRDTQFILENCNDSDNFVPPKINTLISQELSEEYHVRRNTNHKKSSLYQDARQWRSGRNDPEQPGLFEYNVWGLQRSPMVPNFFKETDRFLWSNASGNVGDKAERIPDSVRFPIDRENAGSRRRKRINDFSSELISPDSTSFNPLTRVSDNCVESIRTDINSRMMQLSDDDKEKWRQIKEHINSQMLLENLQLTHGIRSDNYQIVKGNDGYDRIRCGTRTYTASDFLTKELNLNWAEASAYMEKEFIRQKDAGQLKPAVSPSINFWADFKQWQTEPGNSYAEVWADWTDAARKERQILNRQFKARQQDLFRNKTISYTDRRAALAVLRLEKIKARELLEARLKDERMKLKMSLRTDQRYLQFLQQCVERGEAGAVSELRRYSRRVEKRSGSGDYFETPFESDIILNNVSFKVSNKGTVSYLIDDRIAVEDTREWLSVIQPDNDMAIELAIKLAQEKNHYQPLELTGSDEFKEKVIRVALDKKISVKFKDEALQRQYDEMLTKKLSEAREKKTIRHK